MKIEKIKELVSIRNNEIEEQIRDIKNVYDIDVTNKLLEQLVVYSLNAIKYYNEKYNYFSGDEYEQLYLFGLKFYNIRFYNYNLLNSANYQNKNYIYFISLFSQENLVKILNDLFTIIQWQIILHEKRDNYTFNNSKTIDVSKLSIDNIIELNYPSNETELMLVYIYLEQNNDLNVCLKNIKAKIENELSLIKNGISTLIEDIIFNYIEMAEKTNLNSQYYLKSLYGQNTNYNYETHCNILKNIKEMMANGL